MPLVLSKIPSKDEKHFEFFNLILAIFHIPLVTFPPFFARNHPRGQKRGESDEGGVQQQQKNGEGKTEKLKMFLIFGGLPRL